jgi:hypothetical protein
MAEEWARLLVGHVLIRAVHSVFNAEMVQFVSSATPDQIAGRFAQLPQMVVQAIAVHRSTEKLAELMQANGDLAARLEETQAQGQDLAAQLALALRENEELRTAQLSAPPPPPSRPRSTRPQKQQPLLPPRKIDDIEYDEGGMIGARLRVLLLLLFPRRHPDQGRRTTKTRTRRGRRRGQGP